MAANDKAGRGGGHRWLGGSRHARGYGARWEKQRAVALARDEYLCVPCRKRGRVVKASAVDHIVSLKNGGGHELSNLQSICERCHREKTLAEAAKAQGRRHRPRIGVDGFPEDW